MIKLTYQSIDNGELLYRVSIEKPMTVWRFMQEWLDEHTDAWGHFAISRPGFCSWLDLPYCDYEHRNIKGEALPDDLLCSEIKDVSANGRMTRCDFLFELDD